MRSLIPAGMNLHIKVLTGGNSHHVAEAMFKSFAKALDQATSYDPTDHRCTFYQGKSVRQGG